MLWIVRNFFPGSPHVVVLMYHSVGRSDWGFSISPEEFEKQMNYLHKNGYKFLTAENLFEIISRKNSLVKKAVLVTFDDGYRDFIAEAVPILTKYNIPAVVFVHADRSSRQLKNEIPLLDWQEIRELSDKFEIGNHSNSHPNLKKLSANELEDDIKESTRLIQEVTFKKPEIFAYPFGMFNQSTIDILKNSGYKLGFTTDRGMVKVGTDPFKIKRFGIANDTSFIEFKTRLTPASDWYELMIGIFKNKNKKNN